MEKLRRRIDQTDQRILRLISERLRLMDYAKNIKKKLNKPLVDKKRKKYVFDSRIKLAKKLQINQKFAKKLMKTILKGCQKHLTKRP